MFNEELFHQRKYNLKQLKIEPKFLILNAKIANELLNNSKLFFGYGLDQKEMKFHGLKIVITHDEIPNGFLFAV